MVSLPPKLMPHCALFADAPYASRKILLIIWFDLREAVAVHDTGAGAKIGERILIWRGARGMTQVELARSCGLCPSMVCDVERGRRDLRVGQLEALAGRLGLTIAEFFSDALLREASRRHPVRRNPVGGVDRPDPPAERGR
jgi:hypothetical protein